MDYQLVLFDLDNTLLKTERASIVALQRALQVDGVQAEDSEIRQLMGLPGIEMAKKLGSPDPQKTIQQFNQLIAQEVDLIEEYAGISELFAGLREKNINYGIVTSKLRAVYDAEMPHFPELNAIKVVVTADDTTMHKPYGTPIVYGRDKFFPEIDLKHVLYVGDSLFDMQAAHNAGIDFGNAKWGALPADNFSQAEYIFAKPTDILELV